jgi:DNA-binding transcriptional MerR regulator
MQHTSSGGAEGGTAVGEAGGPLSIGAVLHMLRAEFPDVTISKIRFLESEGLVEPRRSPSGYRKFTSGDVDRLSYVLRMQRDHYLPLKVIREHLESRSHLDQPPPPVPAPSRPAPEPEQAEWAETVPAVAGMGRAELLAAAEVRDEELAEWEAYGLICSGPEGDYDLGEVTVARLVADLGRFGLGPRHLRAVKAAADREADLVERVVAPLRRNQNPRARAEAEATARELVGLSAQLHAAFLQNAMRRRSSETPA